MKSETVHFLLGDEMELGLSLKKVPAHDNAKTLPLIGSI